jgi:hypothetical protein
MLSALRRVCLLSLAASAAAGCAASRQERIVAAIPPAPASPTTEQAVSAVAYHQPLQFTEVIPVPATAAGESLEDLEAWAVGSNPTLRRMQEEAAAEWAKAGYAGTLPDPTIGAMFFGQAMNFVPDRQLAEVQVMQMIPWVGRLNAESRHAQYEALAAESL